MVVQAILLIATGCMVVLLLLVFFEPGLPYRLVGGVDRLGEDGFLRLAELLVASEVRSARSVRVLTNGTAFYEAELQAIAAARTSVHIESFIFHPSAIGNRFLSVLADCAKRGVSVRVVVDAIGSFPTPNSYFDELRQAGGQVAWYQPIRWYTLKRLNNRSHRNIIVVDGEVAFIGGAGISRHWSEPYLGSPPWRDTVVRVSGSVVVGLQATFLENWLEASGEMLASKDAFHTECAEPSTLAAIVVTGTPSPARASRARVLFQLLLATAAESIEINSPYFLPDRSARRELIAAAARNVRVRVIVPDRHNNHWIARLASRRQYGDLLRGGVEIFEYQPGMIHAKIMIVDRCCAVVGSTNFDSRSFEINDEVNLAMFDRSLAARFADDFVSDLGLSRQVTLDDWKRRSRLERLIAAICIVLERQE